MTNLLTRIQRVLRGALSLGDWYWSAKLIDINQWPGDFDKARDDIVLRGTGLRFTKSDNLSLLTRRGELERIISAGGQILYKDGINRATLRGITVEFHVPSDIHQFDEIFVRRVKSVTLPANCVVVDIGANVGYAALFFASSDRVDRVYSFEPFPKTVEQFRRNLALNPSLAEKVAIMPYGVEAEASDRKLFYTRAASEALSIYSDTTNPSDPERLEEEIKLVAAVNALNDIRSAHPGRKLVLKLDCEGSEHTIIPALVAAGALKDVPIITMETHFSDCEDIVTSLEDAGYAVFSMTSGHKTFGEVHAVKSSLR